MPQIEHPADRLERYLEARRLELKAEWTDIARAAGIPTETLLQVRRGGLGANRALTRKQVEDAVGWQTGDIEVVRGGGEPTVIYAWPLWTQPTLIDGVQNDTVVDPRPVGSSLDAAADEVGLSEEERTAMIALIRARRRPAE